MIKTPLPLDGERARFRAAFAGDGQRLIVLDRPDDGQPGELLVIADTSVDYKVFTAGADQIAALVDALTRPSRRGCMPGVANVVP